MGRSNNNGRGIGSPTTASLPWARATLVTNRGDRALVVPAIRRNTGKEGVGPAATLAWLATGTQVAHPPMQPPCHGAGTVPAYALVKQNGWHGSLVKISVLAKTTGLN